MRRNWHEQWTAFFRWREVQLDGSIRRRSAKVGPCDEYPNESAAQKAADALRLDIFQDRKPLPGTADEQQKAYSTQYAYEVYLKKWILPRWRSYRLVDVKAVDVAKWLKSLRLARGSKAKIRNLMSALFSHAIRWEWTARNPITSVRQSAKRESVPDVLTPEELAALLSKLPEPLRTAAELDAFTGLRRGELIGLRWEDVDFENLSIHVRRSVVMMVQCNTKTEASAKDVLLDAALAESLLKLRLSSSYNRSQDWVFASPRMKGMQPYWPDALWKRYGRPAIAKAGISKCVGFHTLRQTYTTLLTRTKKTSKWCRSFFLMRTAESLSICTHKRTWARNVWRRAGS